MRIRILTIGNKMPSWVTAGYQEYAKRLPSNYALELIEIPAEKRTKQSQTNIQQIIQREGEKLLAAIKPGNHIIALDVKGQSWTTEQLAKQLRAWHDASHHLDILIGGPDGLSSECLKKANMKWSLSPL